MADPFTRDADCDWCAARPTAPVTIVPTLIQDNLVKAHAITANACRPCARRMRLSPAGGFTAAEQVAMRAKIRAEKRADRRAEMRRCQGELFPLGTVPTSAIHGG